MNRPTDIMQALEVAMRGYLLAHKGVHEENDHCWAYGCKPVASSTEHEFCYAEWHRCDGGGPGEYERYVNDAPRTTR